MTIDWYTKGILTVIAAALIGLCVQNYILEAHASQRVFVENHRDIGRSVAYYAD
jgi:plastocyanin domain-containing protein